LCIDTIDATTAQDADHICSQLGAPDRNSQGCAVTASDNDAGAHSPAKLCCYRTCGHNHDS
jgi:hypothetical protein